MNKALQIADRRSVMLGFAIMALSALFIFFHVIFFEDILDDLVYRYILIPPYSYLNYFGAEKVTSLADAIKSQCSEWHAHSGRFMIHTLTQVFVSVWGRNVFAICTALIVFAIETMLWTYMMKRNNRYPIIWAVTISILFATYSSPVMRHIAAATNYIWPVIVVLPCIYMIKRTASGEKMSVATTVGCILLALLTGCTQEVYNLPLSCALFVLLCYLLIKRHKVTPSLVGMCVALWIGTASIVFAPGTMSRGERLELFMWLKSSLVTWIEYASQMPVVWLTLVATVCVTVRYGRRAMVRLCPFEMMCLLFAMLMSIFVHTRIRSLSGFRLFCLLVFLACMSRLLKEGVTGKYSHLLKPVSILIFLVFTCLQIMQITEDYRYKTHNRAIVEAYMESPDGIVEYTPIGQEYKNEDFECDFAGIRYTPFWNVQLQYTYGSMERPVLPLTQDEMKRFSEIGSNDSLRVPGNSGFYYLTDEIVVRPVDGEEKFETYVAEYKNEQTQHTMIEKLLAIMRRPYETGAETSTLTLTKDDIYHYRLMHTRYGDYIVLFLENTPLSIHKQ